MSLVRRGKIWWVDLASPTGERIRRSSGTDQKELAQEYHDRLKADLWKQSRLKEKPLRTWEEAARLLALLPPHLAPLVGFALATGLRQKNILELTWSQIDMEREILWIHGDQAKGGREIRVPLNGEAMRILEGERGKHPGRVFTYRGKPMETVGEAFDRAVKKAGIEDFRFHDLRHTWASWHVQSGTPLAVLKELGGWASMDMVFRYAHLGESHLAEWAKNSTYGTNTAQSRNRESSK